MKKNNELSFKELKMVCDPELFKFETTAELEAINTGLDVVGLTNGEISVIWEKSST